MNFIFVSLCDNDFQSLAEATEYVWKNKEHPLTEDEFKHFVVNYVVFQNSVRRIHKICMNKDHEHTRRYLEGRIKVEYVDTKPNVDHDGGSVILDVNTGYTWRV